MDLKWTHATRTAPPVPPGTVHDRLRLRGLTWAAIMRARNEGEAEATEELQAILDTMDIADTHQSGFDRLGAIFRA
jgi:hypothetical protein